MNISSELSVTKTKPVVSRKALVSSSDQMMDAVCDQLSLDLKKLLANSSQIKNRLRIVSEKMEIDKKTLLRLAEKGSKPNYITVFKIYRYILNEVDDAKILLRCPDVIRDYLKKASPQTFDKKVSYTASVDKELKSNPVFAELYILCATGPMGLNEIEKRFGLYGKNILQTMLKLGVLAKTNKNEYTLGPQQTTISPETIISMGTQLTLAYAKTDKAHEMNHNIMSFYAEGLNEDAYQKWLKIDQDAIRKKIEIAEMPYSKGTRRAFTFAVTDTLDPKEITK